MHSIVQGRSSQKAIPGQAIHKARNDARCNREYRSTDEALRRNGACEASPGGATAYSQGRETFSWQFGQE
jgi:hypothetical protein